MLHQQGFDPVDAGQFRSEQVWIGPGDAGPRTAGLVAPHHERVPGAIDDLVAFVRRQDIPVLVQVAVAHGQFETIHPFPDGIGRTGRSLAPSILRNNGADRGVLTETTGKARGRVWQHHSTFEVLDDYAAEIRRMSVR